MATPVMSAGETVAMSSAPTRQIGPATRQQAPARVGDPHARRRSPWVPAALAMLGVLAVVALVAGLLLYRDNNNQTATIAVPNVVNKTKTAAEADIRAAGLQPEFRDTVNSADCTVNSVVNQDPQAGTKVERNTTVQYDICGGPDEVTVPDLAGSTKASAETQLRALGLVPDFKEIDGEAPKDQVVRVPDAGKPVPKGQEVIVEISKGNKAKVPDVTGKSEEQARAILGSQGFRVTAREGDTVPRDQAGQVQSQDPEGGTSLVKGRTVTIVVSQPEPEQSPTPDNSPTPSETASPTPPGGGAGGGPTSPGG
jgi:serine/threonine-protein kinase